MFNKKSQISASVPDDILQKYFHTISNEKIICRAPFTSLYFNPDGEVGACCLNKGSYYYGKYPEQSIKGILNSIPRKLHQKFLKADNLLAGCNVCQGNMVSDNFSGILAVGYKNQNIRTHITRIDFELTNNCNLDCIMCERDKSSKVGLYDDNFIKEITPLLDKLEFANFIGGEPFMIDIYYKIWDLIIEKNPNCKIIAQTNGTIINDKIRYYLKKPNFFVGISIDALNIERYNYIRNGANLKMVLQNFDIFNTAMDVKNHNMQISICPIRLNWMEIPELIEFANKKKCLVFFNQVEYPDDLSLKQTPSYFLNHIITEWTNKLNLLNSHEIISQKNIQSFIDLINLLKYWNNNAIFREQKSISVTKGNILDLIKRALRSEHEDFINSIENLMPERWLIDSDRLEKIKIFDFNKQLNLYKLENKTKKEILTEAKRFLEINRIENITYE